VRARLDHEALRETRRELENAERLRSRLFRNVSHELRTPLASIDGFARALLQMEQGGAGRPANPPGAVPPEETRRQFLGIISQEAQRLSKMIEGVLDLSDLEASRQRSQPALAGVRALFEETLATYNMAPTRPKVTVRLPADYANLTIYADREAVVEVLRQLLDNADKFSAGQEIVLGAELVMIGPDRSTQATDSGAHHRVSTATQLYVKDSGPGIPKQDLPYVFDRFYRGESVATVFPGAGLGLAIVRALVNQNNGRVWVDSEPGCGAMFRVLLPSLPPGEE
jgi:two-component system phosphate regulon sensor histidine kinase PhoR